MTDMLGNRMKTQYEDRTRYYLPRRTYTILRLDGRAFHTYTRDCEPFDVDFTGAMNAAARAICEEAQGARLAYVQSDEISVLLTDFDRDHTEAWFDGNLQKQCSVAASIVSVAFAQQREMQRKAWDRAHFDCRAFTIPDPVEVENYFIWRQVDAIRNSVQMLGQAHFSPKELHGLSGNEIQEKLMTEAHVNYNDLPDSHKRGIVWWQAPWTALRRDLVPAQHQARYTAQYLDEKVESRKWERIAAPWFTRQREWLTSQVPQHA